MCRASDAEIARAEAALPPVPDRCPLPACASIWISPTFDGSDRWACAWCGHEWDVEG